MLKPAKQPAHVKRNACRNPISYWYGKSNGRKQRGGFGPLTQRAYVPQAEWLVEWETKLCSWCCASPGVGAAFICLSVRRSVGESSAAQGKSVHAPCKL